MRRENTPRLTVESVPNLIRAGYAIRSRFTDPTRSELTTEPLVLAQSFPLSELITQTTAVIGFASVRIIYLFVRR
ncbi:hypothetical protein GCM10007171_22080 [Dickeya fangzhongdai]|nr:hypothetical protein GCM10007171_22080 [Dickeya fangzhongdai]